MKLTDAVRFRLRNIIEERGLTQYQIHKEGGIAKSTISQMLSGKKERIEIHTLYEITATIGISLKDFFDDPMFNDIED